MLGWTLPSIKTVTISDHMSGASDIPDPDRNNAIFLMEFLQSHLLIIPHTFSDLPPSWLVSYKEMTSITDSLNDFSV